MLICGQLQAGMVVTELSHLGSFFFKDWKSLLEMLSILQDWCPLVDKI